MKNGEREIKIGRQPTNDIFINDKLLSRVHCHIKLVYDPMNNEKYDWIIYDGKKGQPSTNGAWLYINQDLPIYDGFTFKSNQTAIICHVEEPEREM